MSYNTKDYEDNPPLSLLKKRKGDYQEKGTTYGQG